MPNQLNYPNQIPVPYISYRPDRLAQTDKALVGAGTKQILFGTNKTDVLEFWAYDSNGSISGHVTLSPNSDILSLTTLVDNTGDYEMLNLDMGAAIRRLTLEQGRYGLVINFFRNEVGSEDGEHLYIVDISDDRTELKLYPVKVTNTILHDIHEWVLPSVPKIEAQGLLAQTFGQGPAADISGSLNILKITTELNNSIEGTSDRIGYADTQEPYVALTQYILDLAYQRAIDHMAADVDNPNIQDEDLQFYIDQSVSEIIRELRDQNIIDPRFDVF